MSSVKELLKKIINEEIDKLEEQSRWGNLSNQDKLKKLRMLDAQAGSAGGIDLDGKDPQLAMALFYQLLKVNKYVVSHFPNAWKVVKAKYPKEAAKIKQQAAELQGIPKTKEGCPVGHTKDNTGKCVPVKSEFRPPEDGQSDDGQKAGLAASRPSAKGKGAAAGKGVAKRKPRRKSMDILELQSLLKMHFGDKINLGRTGKNKDGVDGVYGSKTQRAINLLRKTTGAPPRQKSFKKSIRALIDHLKGAGKGSGMGIGKGISGKKYNAAEIGSVLKNMNLVVSPDDPKAKDLINKLMRAQAKGTQLNLRKIKLAGDTALGLKEVYQYAEDEDCEEWSVIIDEARELLESGTISKRVFKKLKKSVPKGCGHH